jgi:fatty-acyl-CoA synthase
MLHALGVGPEDAVAVLLPGCLEYHLALWGRRSGRHRAAAQPAAQRREAGLADDGRPRQGVDRLRLGRGIAHVVEGRCACAARCPTLTTVLRVAPHDEPVGSAGDLPEGVADFNAMCAHVPADRLASGRDIAPGDIAAYFHTGGTTGAPKLARHSHGAQVFTAWASVKLQGLKSSDVTINGYPLFHVAGVLPASLSALSRRGSR